MDERNDILHCLHVTIFYEIVVVTVRHDGIHSLPFQLVVVVAVEVSLHLTGVGDIGYADEVSAVEANVQTFGVEQIVPLPMPLST